MDHHIIQVRKDNNDNIVAVKLNYGSAYTTAQVVSLINSKVHSFYTWDGVSRAAVAVYDEKWIRSHANGKWTDNLDNLPRF